MISEGLLHFVEFELQIIALLIFGGLYALRINHVARLPMPKETASPKGSAAKGVAVSFATIFYPWSMDSTKKHWWRWIEFALYHLAATAAIGATFTLPFAPQIMTYPVRMVLAGFIAVGVVMGIIKLVRRLVDPYLRLVSIPDDYFSLAALEVYFVAGVGCLVFYTPQWRFIYFLVTAAFLIYVPFSKISHYLYWFFSRTLLGLRYGRRGVIAKKEASL